MYRIIPLLCSFLLCQLAFSQTKKFNLSFQNRELGTNDTFCVDLALSFDQQNRLGSSNLVFSYDTTILSNPRLESDYLESSQNYVTSTLTMLRKEVISVNVELLALGGGKVIEAAPYKTLIARVCFDRVDSQKIGGLKWIRRGTTGTIVYVDDEQNKLEAALLTDEPVVGNPVDLISFTAVQEGRDARLKWVTVAESKTSAFEIERSIDRVLFSKVGEVDSENITDIENTYEFLDENIQQEESITFYYRIKQLEMDGAPRYSEVISLTIEPTEFFTVEVNPNPFREQIDLTFRHSTGHSIQIRIVSPLGKILYDQNFEENEGKIKINATSLPAGFLYVLAESVDGKHIAMKKVAKIK
ncbi:MAG: T9SS type A sorting domain-containing protein [Bacteroidota bacterium]